MVFNLINLKLILTLNQHWFFKLKNLRLIFKASMNIKSYKSVKDKYPKRVCEQMQRAIYKRHTNAQYTC